MILTGPVRILILYGRGEATDLPARWAWPCAISSLRGSGSGVGSSGTMYLTSVILVGRNIDSDLGQVYPPSPVSELDYRANLMSRRRRSAELAYALFTIHSYLTYTQEHEDERSMIPCTYKSPLAQEL